MLGQCGIRTKIIAQPVQEFLAPGPDGPVFGRSFDLAQFAWAGSFVPACNLYLTSEITGPYPDFPKGWGGMNASGYTNPQFDAACGNALFSLADAPQHRSEHLRRRRRFFQQNCPQYLCISTTMCRLPGQTYATTPPHQQ